MTNSIRHGLATNIVIILKKVDEKIILTISDNGKGISGDIKYGYGLSGIRERVAWFNGSLEISSDKESGFSIQVKMPIYSQTVSDKIS